ncbi:MAG: hypothetical protein HYR63_28335 [Proteobacteria bacterium]|nr:hypothetical protein [Pseudomonadota bacterium]MBI3499813.1 hypothetical protein [Pseudomonadota bacterium]
MPSRSKPAKIQRLPGRSPGRSAGSAHGPFAWTATTATDKTGDLVVQVRQVFEKLQSQLLKMGSDKRNIISATVWLADLRQKPLFDEEWLDWVGPEPQHWPQRACIGATLADGSLVEIAVLALRQEP